MDSARDLLVFEHIPKTAGSTMHAILWRLYGGKRVFMATIRGRHREHLEALGRRLHEPPPLKAVVSHIGFGFYERLAEAPPPVHYTFLRNPVDRVLSHYYFQIQRGQLDPSTTLETFVRQDLSRACNVQTAFLGGLEAQHNLDGITLSPDLYTEALLESAKANLRRMDAFGLTERFDESLLLLGEAFGWKRRRLYYVARRVGRLRATRPRHPDHVLKLIRQYNELDLELYHYAQALFEEQRTRLLPDGGPDVKTFQRLNAVFSLIHPRTRPVRRALRRTVKALKG